MSNAPLVSIVLCTYNGERFLEAQLESLLAQTYRPLEIIVSDDRSTDSTPSILQRYRQVPGLKLVFQKANLGVTKNFESAASLATGDYLAFCDQDDIWLPHKVEKLVAAIGPHSLVYSNSRLINEQGTFLNKCLSDLKRLQNSRSSEGFVFLNTVPGHTMMIRRELLRYALPLPEGYYHDWWLAAQAATHKGIVYRDEVLTLYRRHPHTATKITGNKQRASRKAGVRYQEYEKELRWIELLYQNPLEPNKAFYRELYELYSRRRKGRFVWPLFFFLLRHQQQLFRFSRKNFLSRFVEIRKLSRGEKQG